MMPSALTETITQNSNMFFHKLNKNPNKTYKTKVSATKYQIQNSHTLYGYHINRTFKAFGDKIFTIICSKHILHNL